MEHRIEAIEAIAQRERRRYQTFGIRPLSPVIGAEIEGLDLSRELSPEELVELRLAYLEHHVLVFQGQDLSEREHMQVARQLGFAPEPGRRAFVLAAHDRCSAGEPVTTADTWRADETYRYTPPAGSVLYIRNAPPAGCGGDMAFANMHLAYDLLSEPLRELLSDMTAEHIPDPGGPVICDANSTAMHPVVAAHPETGRPALFVNRRHTSHIAQLDPTHSLATVDMLCRHVEMQPVLTCRFRWAPNTVVVWDNRSTQHVTLQDFRPERLSGHLVSLAGDAPIRCSAFASRKGCNLGASTIS